MEELKEVFVTKIYSEKRLELFENLMKYNTDFKKECGLYKLHQWINGSFISKKKDPRDIDLVTFIPAKDIERIGPLINKFKAPNSSNAYNVDGYIVVIHPEESKKRKLTNLDRVYWMNHFSSTKPNRRGKKFEKGFLEIIH